jgi:hypothetical protein
MRLRLRRGVNPDSHAGVDGALGFMATFPLWFMMFGLMFVLGYWFWALALNAAGIQKGAFYQGIGANGKAIHAELVTAGLGGYASAYLVEVPISKQGERAFVGQMDKTIAVTFFTVPKAVTVKARSISREERFYEWKPASGWE